MTAVKLSWTAEFNWSSKQQQSPNSQPVLFRSRPYPSIGHNRVTGLRSLLTTAANLSTRQNNHAKKIMSTETRGKFVCTYRPHSRNKTADA
jgi:hypothetical protein